MDLMTFLKLSLADRLTYRNPGDASASKKPPGSPTLLLFSPLPRPLLPPLLPTLLPSWSKLPPSGESEPTEDNSDWESFRARRCLQIKPSEMEEASAQSNVLTLLIGITGPT